MSKIKQRKLVEVNRTCLNSRSENLVASGSTSSFWWSFLCCSRWKISIKLFRWLLRRKCAKRGFSKNGCTLERVQLTLHEQGDQKPSKQLQSFENQSFWTWEGINLLKKCVPVIRRHDHVFFSFLLSASSLVVNCCICLIWYQFTFRCIQLADTLIQRDLQKRLSVRLTNSQLLFSC